MCTGFCKLEKFPSPKSHSHDKGPLVERSVKAIVELQLTLSLKSNILTGGACGNVQVQSTAKPAPSTPPSEDSKIVIAPPLETTIPGLPVNELQY